MVLFVVIQVIGCSTERRTDESMIKEQIEHLEAAIETHNRSDFMSIIDSEYQDKLNSNRKSLQTMLLGLFFRYKDISVFSSAHEFNIMQIRAEVRSQIVITGGHGLIPDKARHYQLKSCWKKESGEWLLYCLDWQ